MKTVNTLETKGIDHEIWKRCILGIYELDQLGAVSI